MSGLGSRFVAAASKGVLESGREAFTAASALVEKGNSVVVIEHNMDVLKNADWIIDLGPDGGGNGGEIIAEGTPKEIAVNKKSYTGAWLRKVI